MRKGRHLLPSLNYFRRCQCLSILPCIIIATALGIISLWLGTSLLAPESHLGEGRLDDQFVPTYVQPAYGGAEKDDGGGVLAAVSMRFDPRSQRHRLESYVNRTVRVEVPDADRKLAFVHVGKAAGSTISSLLRNGCHAWAKRPCRGRNGTILSIPNETVASFRIKSYYHVTTVPYDNYTSFVVTARNPLKRAASAFLCNHPTNIKELRRRRKEEARRQREAGFRPPPPLTDGPSPKGRAMYRCYPTLEEFAQAVASHSRLGVIKTNFTTAVAKGSHEKRNEEVTLNCTQIAQRSIAGKEKGMGHLYFNYRFYVGAMPPEKEVFVIRNEHLWHDWNAVNRLLGQTGDVVIPQGSKARKRMNEGLPLVYNLTADGARSLCSSLQAEIQQYINLLNRAVNLSDEDILASIEDIKESCPKEFST